MENEIPTMILSDQRSNDYTSSGQAASKLQTEFFGTDNRLQSKEGQRGSDDQLPSLTISNDYPVGDRSMALPIVAANAEKQTRRPYSLPYTAEELKAMDDIREVTKIEHNMDLLAGATNRPERFAKELAEKFAIMPQERINELGKIMEDRKFVHIERDENNNVVSISDNRRTPPWNNPHVGLLDAPLYYPAIGLIKGVKAIQHLVRGSDAELNISKNEVTVHGRNYFDITGKGIWNGSNEFSVQRSVPTEK